MTSLVALMNKNGVAMAADSAASIGEGVKIFQTASKIFEFIPSHQIGMMTYGDANFCGIPWDIILNEYQMRIGDKPRETLESYVREFIDFLSNNSVLFTNETVEYNLHQYAIRQIYLLEKKLDEERKKARVKRLRKTQEEKLAVQVVTEEFSNIVCQNYLGHITADIASKFADDYLLDLQNAIKEYEQTQGEDYNDEVLQMLAKYSIDVMLRDCRWDDGSGIVFVGFGSRDIFPSLVELKFKGLFGNILAYKKEESIYVTQENPAQWKAFTQNAPILEFVYGMGPSVYNLLDKFFDTNLPEILKNATLALNPPFDLDEEAVGQLAHTIKKEFDDIEGNYLVYYSSTLLDVLQVLGLPELAAAAENLLNLVILRGKLSPAPETVGGPIDVAIISKLNGFKRIKQKSAEKMSSF